MRFIVLLALCLLTRSAFAQPLFEPRQVVREQVKMTAKITLVSMSGCRPCEEADTYHAARYRASGWQWEKVTDAKPRGTYPQWIVCVGDVCERFHCSRDQLDDRVKAVIARATRPASQAMRAAFETVKRVTQPKRWGQHEGHVTQSVRGQTIEYHLTEGHADYLRKHGISIDGMTPQQMDALHQRIHGWNY